MNLEKTFAASQIHEEWVSVYRSDPIQNKFNDQIMDRIMGHLNPRPGAVFLDAGCGTGDHAVRIAQRGYACIGVDISERVLCKAWNKAAEADLRFSLSFTCQPLENLAFSNNAFDVVHCRGVLMHIPDWEAALDNLCRVLKPGGRIVILEANHTSLETALVLLTRRIKKGKSRIVETPGGLEHWSEENGNPFVARTANIKYIMRILASHRISVVKRFSTEFWDINRFPAGIARSLAIRFNQLWFFLRLPAHLSAGNALVGEKISG
jgi:ubiquinone/menaquinone biosynthesis C-methylase UbiE